jgi:hypothetical protein
MTLAENKKGILLIIVGLVFIAIGIFNLVTKDSLAGEGGQGATSCTVVASTTVIIGNQSSTRIVQPYAQNAYVIVQQPMFATNTVALSFNSSSTILQGYDLASAPTATTSPDKLVFGLNSDFPFTGFVEAITSAGSTTIGVTVCRY